MYEGNDCNHRQLGYFEQPIKYPPVFYEYLRNAGYPHCLHLHTKIFDFFAC